MAMKKRAVSNRKTANDDTVIYKVMIALGVACIAILALQMVSRYYRLSDYIVGMYTALGWAAIVFGVLSAAALVCFLILRKQAAFWRIAGLPLFGILLVFSFSCALMHFTWVTYVAALYFLYIAIPVLYIIGLLYQHEFLLLSVVNACAGAVFFWLSRIYGDGASFPPKAAVLTVLLALVVLAAATLMFVANRHGGKLKLGGKERQIFTHGASPLLLYVSCAVWLICLDASALLGSVFAYYCMFAVVAFELGAAVYYTVKLS